MNMIPVVGRDSRERGRRGELDRGLFCCSFLQFFLWVVFSMSKTQVNGKTAQPLR